MNKPVMSELFKKRMPSDVRLGQMKFAERKVKPALVNVAIGNVSLPTNPAMMKIRLHDPRLCRVRQARVQDLGFHLPDKPCIKDREEDLHAPVEVAPHEVRAPEIHLLAAAIAGTRRPGCAPESVRRCSGPGCSRSRPELPGAGSTFLARSGRSAHPPGKPRRGAGSSPCPPGR